MRTKAYCITMRTTPERHERARKLFESFDFPVTFHVAERDPQGGIYGCWRSHLACWDKAVEAGYDVIAVFEDDVEIPSRAELDYLLEEGRRAFERQPDLEYIALHGKTIPVGTDQDAVKSGVAITTCAYMIHLPRFLRRGRENIEPTGKHFDFDLYYNSKGPVYTKVGVFEPAPKIMPGIKFGTVNDYGVVLNTAFKIFGYGNVVSWMDLYINTLRCVPRKMRPWLRPFNEIGIKLFQPAR